MKEAITQLTPWFKKELRQNGILSILEETTQFSVKKVLRIYGNYTQKEIETGLFSETRDVLFPQIVKSVRKIIQPWIKSGSKEYLPQISFNELAKTAKLPVAKIIKTLQENLLILELDGKFFTAKLYLQDYPDGPLSIKNGTKLGISPRRVTRLAQYRSRPPGGGAIQKIRIQEKKISKILKTLAPGNGYVEFTSESAETLDNQ